MTILEVVIKREFEQSQLSGGQFSAAFVPTEMQTDFHFSFHLQKQIKNIISIKQSWVVLIKYTHTHGKTITGFFLNQINYSFEHTHILQKLSSRLNIQAILYT